MAWRGVWIVGMEALLAAVGGEGAGGALSLSWST